MTLDELATSDEDADIAQTSAVWRRRLGRIGRVARPIAVRWRLYMLTILLVASVGWAGGLFYFDYYRDQQTGKAEAREVIKAASDGTVALLSYSPDSLGQDIDNVKPRLTSDFQSSFKRFTEQIVTSVAEHGQVTTTVQVIRAAVTELQPNKAVVLAFIRQKMTTKKKPEAEAVNTSNSVRVSLVKADGRWLINDLEKVEPPPDPTRPRP